MRCLALLLLAGLALAQEDEGGGGEKEAADRGLGALGGLDWKAKPIDFKKVDRTIRKVPELTSEKPLYGLFLFGIEGETRVWAVLDVSAKDKKDYDVLYLDRNADGDLTGKDERIEGKQVTESESPLVIRFGIGDFKEPGTDVVHNKFVLMWTELGVHYRIQWAGGSTMEGPCGSEPLDRKTRADFADSPREAPIYVLGTERPFDFEQVMSGVLKRGEENDVKVLIGNKGDRRGAFTCVDTDFLPEGERILVQLVCKDAAGTERKLTADLKERSAKVLYHGPVKIPKDAKPGPAIMRVRLPESSAYESFTTEIPVTIE